MDYIVIFPFAKPTKDGFDSPKNYPYWEELIKLLNSRGFEVIQISPIEKTLKGVKLNTGLIPFNEIVKIVEGSYTYISVDSFAPHLLQKVKRGVVIFGISDPAIWGYAKNINILKSRAYLKDNPFDCWWAKDKNDDAYVSPIEVIKNLSNL